MEGGGGGGRSAAAGGGDGRAQGRGAQLGLHRVQLAASDEVQPRQVKQLQLGHQPGGALGLDVEDHVGQVNLIEGGEQGPQAPAGPAALRADDQQGLPLQRLDPRPGVDVGQGLGRAHRTSRGPCAGRPPRSSLPP